MLAKLSCAWQVRICLPALALVCPPGPTLLAEQPAHLTAAPPAAFAAPLQPGERTHLVLKAKQNATLEVRGPANSLVALQLDLDGGLLAISSPGLPKYAIDLGKGGGFTYVVDLGATGDALVRLDSIEQQRPAELDLTRLSTAPPNLDTMRRAEEALIVAESARKHLPGAPAPEAALADYALAALLARQMQNTVIERLALTQNARYLAWGRSDVEAARTLLLEAAALPAAPADTASRALTLKSLSSAEVMLGHYSAAIEAGEQALALYRVTGDLYWQGIVLGNLASVYAETGDIARGAQALREGLADAEATQDGAGVVYCLSQLAAIDRQRGDFESAFQSFRDALAWVDHIGYAPLIEAEIEKELGLFDTQLGMWSEADTELHRSLAHLNGIENTTSLEAREALARGLAERRRYAQAARAYDEAALIADRLKLRREQLLLLLGRAAVLAMEGRSAPSQADLDHAAAIADDLGSPALHIRVELTRAAIAIRPSDALQAFTAAVAQAQASGEREEEAAALAGQAHTLDEISRQHRSTGSGPARFSDDNKPPLAPALPDIGPGDALPIMLRALQLVEQSRSNLDSHDLASSYFNQHHLWYEWATAIAMHQAKASSALASNSRSPVQLAFALAERGRARSMLDSVEERGWGPALNLPPELASRSARNREAIENQRDLLGSRVADLSVTAATLRRLYQEQDAIEAEERSLTSTSTSQHREGAHVGAALRPVEDPGLEDARLDLLHSRVVGVGDVQQALLGPGDAMIAFSLTPAQSYRWLITRQSVETQLLPGRDQLQRSIAPLLAALESRRPVIAPGEDVRSFAERRQRFTAQRDRELTRIGALLLSGIPSQIHTLYVVGDGPLLALPWNALRLQCGERSCSAIERFEILSEPSASVAVALSRSATEGPDTSAGAPGDNQGNTSGDTSVLIVADPATALDVRDPLRPALPALEDARREASVIRRYTASAELLEGREATPAAVLDWSRQVSPSVLRSSSAGTSGASGPGISILHIAAHTVLVAQHPELSGIALAPPRAARHVIGSETDPETGADHATGVLRLRDISSMQAPPLVVLSGCQTQGGSRLAGEALQSLAQAFFFAGAHGVVASLWSIEDASAAALMSSFYRNLLEDRMSPPAALRAAELGMLHAGSDVSDWAPFVFTGVPGVPSPPQSGSAQLAVKAPRNEGCRLLRRTARDPRPYTGPGR